MISVKEAINIIGQHVIDFGLESVPIYKSIGRILREPIMADRDFPPYDRVAMDGIAIKYSDFEKGIRQFDIKGVVSAGTPQMELRSDGGCLEIMTGAILPKGLDTVIRYEDVDIQNGRATVSVEALEVRQNIHPKGSDRKENEVIISSGKKLSASEIAICATVGKSEVVVSKLPKALIISTGDELVDVDQNPKAHQIRKSNSHTLKALLQSFQLEADLAHLNDEYEPLVKKMEAFLEQYDVLILSGGVSKGKFDYLPKALEELAVQKHFHRVAQRPGKPFWFGTKGRKVVFALPGNPTSSFVCMLKYINPWLCNSLQMNTENQPKAVLGQDVHFKPDLTYFLEVKMDYNSKGQWIATPVKGNGSGDIANLVDADAFIELPSGKGTYLKGEAFNLLYYRF